MEKNLALILLYDEWKRVLLQHRDEDAPALPGYWAFFGGGIEEGESPEQAVRREAKEELNYDLKNPILVMTQSYKDETRHGKKYIFMEEYDFSKKIVQREGQGMEWVEVDETKGLKIVGHDLEVLRFIKGKY